MADAGLYTIPVALTFDGVGAQVETQLNRAIDGRRIGQELGRDLAQGVRASQSDVDRALDGYRDAYQDAARSTQTLRDAEQQLATERSQTNRDMQRIVELSARVANARRDEERATERATRAAEEYSRVRQDVESSAGESGGDAGEESGTAFVGGFAGKLKGLAGAGGAIALALTAAVGAVAGPAALLANEFTQSFDREVNLDRIGASLALTEGQITALGDSAREVWTNNFGTDLVDVQDSMASVASTFDVAGAQLESLTGKAITFRDVYGTDLPETLATANSLISSGLASNADEAMDLLAAAFAATPEMLRDEIPALAREYGGVFNALGFSGSESLGMLSEMANNSEFAMDKLGDSLKEFTLLATDLGNADAQALFEGWGLNQPDVANNLLAGGDVAADQFAQIVDKLLEIPDPAAQAQAAIALFGTPLEDLGKDQIPEFLQSLDDGQTSLADFAGAADDMVATAGDNAAGSLESAFRTIEGARMEMQDQLAEAFGPAVQDAATWITDHQEEIVGFFEELAAGALYAGSTLVTMAGMSITAIGGIGQALGDVVGWAADAWEELLGGIAAVMEALPDELVPDGWAEGVRTAQQFMNDLSDDAHDFGTDTTEFGNSLFDTAEDLAQYGNAIHQGGIEVVGLGQAIEQTTEQIDVMPDGKTFTLDSNTPAVQEELETLGFTVEELPDGTVQVTANTQEAQTLLDAWKADQGTMTINVRPVVQPGSMEAAFAPWQIGVGTDVAGNNTSPIIAGVTPGFPNAFGSIRAYAFGGLPTNALIQPATRGLVQWAEPSTHGEAFIPLAPDRRGRSLAIWAETGRRLGAFPMSFAQGGLGDAGGLLPFTSELRALIGQTWPQISEIGGYRSPDGYNEHSSGRALDVMIPNWQSPAGIALGNQIAAWALSIPGVNRVMWQQSTINADGTRTPVPDRGSPTQNHMDHVHIFTDDVGAGVTPTPQLSFGTNTSMASSTSGIGPDGQSGTYSVDQGAVSEAQGRVAEADARVREAEAKQRELAADAKESEVIAAQNEVDSAKRDAAEARTALQEAQRGEFTPNSESSSNSGGPEMSEIGSIFKSFFTETFGLDGSWLPDIGNLMPLQMADTLLSSFHPEALYQPGAILNPDGSTPLPSGSTSFAPFGLPDTMTALPNGAGPGAVGTAAGGAPIIQQTVDNSQTFNGNVGWDPAQAARQHQRQIKSNRAEPRLPTGF